MGPLPTLGKMSKSGREAIFYWSEDKGIPLASWLNARWCVGSHMGIHPTQHADRAPAEKHWNYPSPFQTSWRVTCKQPTSLMGHMEPSPSAWLGMNVSEPESLPTSDPTTGHIPTKSQNLPASKVFLSPTPHSIPGHGKNHPPFGKGEKWSPEKKNPTERSGT